MNHPNFIVAMVTSMTLWAGCGSGQNASTPHQTRTSPAPKESSSKLPSSPKTGEEDATQKIDDTDTNQEELTRKPAVPLPSLPPLGPSALGWNGDDFVGSSALLLLPLE